MLIAEDTPTYITIEILEDNEWKEIVKFQLEKLCILLGRGRGLKIHDIKIDDSICSKEIYNKISSVHLTFYRRSRTEKENHRYLSVEGYAVRDGYGTRASTNGSTINGKPLICRTNLENGDIIQIGKNIRVIYYQNIRAVVIADREDTLAEKPTEEI
jgi:pSer/pThr/pTyr-binding forkhead associated (FHA) protein